MRSSEEIFGAALEEERDGGFLSYQPGNPPPLTTTTAAAGRSGRRSATNKLHHRENVSRCYTGRDEQQHCLNSPGAKRRKQPGKMKPSPGRRVCCLLCQRSEETKTTGALSTKDRVTAHQNCLVKHANYRFPVHCRVPTQQASCGGEFSDRLRYANCTELRKVSKKS